MYWFVWENVGSPISNDQSFPLLFDCHFWAYHIFRHTHTLKFWHISHIVGFYSYCRWHIQLTMGMHIVHMGVSENNVPHSIPFVDHHFPLHFQTNPYALFVDSLKHRLGWLNPIKILFLLATAWSNPIKTHVCKT